MPSSDSEFPPEEKLSRDKRKLLLGCALMPVVLIFFLGGVWYFAHHQAKQRLAEQVAKVRARNEPLTTPELNDFYQPAPNRPDMTAQIVAALSLCEAAGAQQSGKDLPIVGEGMEPPPPPQEWPQIADVETYLAPLERAIATFHEVARTDATARFPADFSAGQYTLLSNTQSVRSGARVLSLQFHVHLHRGEMKGAVECVLAQLALAKVLDQEPMLISQLVRLAVTAIAQENARLLLQQPGVSDADLLRVQQVLRGIDFKAGLKRALAGERAIGYMACIDAFGAASASAPLSPAEAQEKAARQPQRSDDAAKILEHNLRIAEAADQSLLAGLREAEAIEAELHLLKAGFLSRMSYMMTLMFTPTYRMSVTAFARTAARRDCTDTAIAAELYRRKNGHWPTTLEQLVPEFLPSVPRDSFTDQPLKVVSTDAELKIYSVGKDGQDDGGKFSDKLEPGTDLGVSLLMR